MKKKNFKLAEAMMAKGLRQADVVRLVKLTSESRLSRILNYLVKPTEDDIKKISILLGVDESVVRGGV